ncbi:MAG: hypothetical protein JWN46_1396 [Acidimicrobiales bacterium]|nr:hypothetical protein [Acidimicrobiales bacterium]
MVQSIDVETPRVDPIDPIDPIDPSSPTAAEAVAPEPAPGPGRRSGTIASGMRWAIGAYAASRLIVMAAAVAAEQRFHGANMARGPWPKVGHGPLYLRPLLRWDAAWYLDIARKGYVHSGSARHLRPLSFFPLLPMLVRALSWVTGSSVETAAMVLSVVAGAGAAVMIWLLMHRLAGPTVANRAVVLFCLFPGAFVLSMPYAEPLLVAAGAGALIALADRRWVLAGICAALATAARPNAGPLILACFVAAVVAIRAGREWRALWAPALAPLGVIGYFAYLAVHTGDALAWFHSEHNGWHERIDFGHATLSRAFSMITHPHVSLGARGFDNLLMLFGVVWVALSLWALWRWRPPLAVWVFALVTVAMAVGSMNIGPRPRMLIGAFPLVVAPAVRGRAHWVLAGAYAIGLAGLSYLIFTGQSVVP